MINESDIKPVDINRRRLTRGGLATPVVLATLASKNALAVPYQCTLSGKLSNNASPHGPKTSEDCHVGQGATYWSTALLGDTNTFNAIFGVNLYYYKPTKIGNSTMLEPKTPATLLQVLTIAAVPNTAGYQPQELSFAKQAVVLYKNAPVSGDVYPLTKQQVIDMFKAVIDNQNYTINAASISKAWTPADIRSYFNELYFV